MKTNKNIEHILSIVERGLVEIADGSFRLNDTTTVTDFNIEYAEDDPDNGAMIFITLWSEPDE